MKVQCIACACFRFQKGFDKKPTEAAKTGFGRCKHRPEAWVHVSAHGQRECSQFEAQEAGRVARLEQWLSSEEERIKHEQPIITVGSEDRARAPRRFQR